MFQFFVCKRWVNISIILLEEFALFLLIVQKIQTEFGVFYLFQDSPSKLEPLPTLTAASVVTKTKSDTKSTSKKERTSDRRSGRRRCTRKNRRPETPQKKELTVDRDKRSNDPPNKSMFEIYWILIAMVYDLFSHVHSRKQPANVAAFYPALTNIVVTLIATNVMSLASKHCLEKMLWFWKFL